MPAVYGQVTISWAANVEADLAGYRVYYGLSALGPFTQLQDVGLVTSVTITTFPTYGTLWFTVTAYDTSNNNSAFSSAVSMAVSPKMFPMVWG